MTKTYRFNWRAAIFSGPGFAGSFVPLLAAARGYGGDPYANASMQNQTYRTRVRVGDDALSGESLGRQSTIWDRINPRLPSRTLRRRPGFSPTSLAKFEQGRGQSVAAVSSRVAKVPPSLGGVPRPPRPHRAFKDRFQLDVARLAGGSGRGLPIPMFMCIGDGIELG
jgi:hypothetical protein